jgi:5'(3')-deoxyribonucleotidase
MDDKRRPVILLDVDGVMTDFVGQMIKIINDQFPLRSFTHEDITEWNVEKCIDLDIADVSSYCLSIMSQPGFVMTMRPKDGTIQGIKVIQSLGDVYAVTSPMVLNPLWEAERRTWLKNIVGLDRKQVISTAAKHLIVGDVFVDDKATNITRWHEAFPHGRALLWDAPYNRDRTHYDDGTSIERVNDWHGVIRIIDDIVRKN